MVFWDKYIFDIFIPKTKPFIFSINQFETIFSRVPKKTFFSHDKLSSLKKIINKIFLLKLREKKKSTSLDIRIIKRRITKIKILLWIFHKRVLNRYKNSLTWIYPYQTLHNSLHSRLNIFIIYGKLLSVMSDKSESLV